MITKEELSKYYRKLASKGGLARAAKLSPKRRSEIARNAGRAKGKKKKVATILSVILMTIIWAYSASCGIHPGSATYPTGGTAVIGGVFVTEYHCIVGNHNFYAK